MKSTSGTYAFSALLAAALGTASVPAGAQMLPDPVPPAPVVVPTLTPQAVALRDAMAPQLAALPAADAAAIGQFYVLRDYAPFWTEPGSPRVAELIAALDTSEAQALPRARYGTADLAEPVDAADPAALAEREVAATQAYLRFATDLSKGVIVPLRSSSRTSPASRSRRPRPRSSPRSRPRRWPAPWKASRRRTRTIAG